MTLAVALVCHLGRGAAASKSLSENDLLKLLQGGVYNARIASLVRYRGINFVPTRHDVALLQRAGADQELFHEVLTAPRMLPQITQHQPQVSRPLHLNPQPVHKAAALTAPNAINVRHATLNSLNAGPLGGDFPANYYMPVGWPKPSWENWQLRDVDVIDMRRIPGERSGYCYGKRIMYERLGHSLRIVGRRV